MISSESEDELPKTSKRKRTILSSSDSECEKEPQKSSLKSKLKAKKPRKFKSAFIQHTCEASSSEVGLKLFPNKSLNLNYC